MTKKKAYTTVDLFRKINMNLKESGRLPDFLDYGNPTSKEIPLKSDEWEVYGITRYGGNEGIYTDIYLDGDIGGMDSPKGNMQRINIGTYKTLNTDPDSFRAMHVLSADFTMETDRFRKLNIEAFNFDGYRVVHTGTEEGVKKEGSFSTWHKDYKSAFEQAKKMLSRSEIANIVYVTITDLATDEKIDLYKYEAVINVTGMGSEKDGQHIVTLFSAPETILQAAANEIGVPDIKCELKNINGNTPSILLYALNKAGFDIHNEEVLSYADRAVGEIEERMAQDPEFEINQWFKIRQWVQDVIDSARAKEIMGLDSPSQSDPEPEFVVNAVSAGGVKKEIMFFDTEEEAFQWCNEQDWTWVDENQFEWDLEIDDSPKVELYIREPVMYKENCVINEDPIPDDELDGYTDPPTPTPTIKR